MALTAYPINFTTTWTYNATSDYQTLGQFTNNQPYKVCIRKVALYVGTGVGTFTDGSYVYGNGSTIKSWVGFFKTDGTSLGYFPPDGGGSSTTDGLSITKQVGTLWGANGTYPDPSACGLYEYTNVVAGKSPVNLIVDPGATIMIKITGGYFTSVGSGVLCIDKYGINYSTRKSYIYVEPYNPNVTLTLKYNYSGAPSDKILSVPINNNTSLGSPSRTGYTFDGWYTASSGGNKVSDPYKVTKNTTLYAHWTVKQYTISYNANGGGNAPNPQSANYASQITLTISIPERSGFIFSSWNTDPQGTGISYAPGNTITMPATNITLYAQWLQAPPIWVYSTTDNEWYNAADPSDIQNYRPIYRYDGATSQWVKDRNLKIYNNDEWKEVTSNGGQ